MLRITSVLIIQESLSADDHDVLLNWPAPSLRSYFASLLIIWKITSGSHPHQRASDAINNFQSRFPTVFHCLLPPSTSSLRPSHNRFARSESPIRREVDSDRPAVPQALTMMSRMTFYSKRRRSTQPCWCTSSGPRATTSCPTMSLNSESTVQVVLAGESPVVFVLLSAYIMDVCSVQIFLRWCHFHIVWVLRVQN